VSVFARCASFGLAFAVAVAPAASQSAADSARADSAARKLKAVTVTESRSAGVVGGASAVVIRPVELRSSPAPSLEQALRESPFVHVRQNSRGEMELSVRGSDSRQAAVLVDGVPLTLGWDHRADPSLIPLTGAQSLLIVRGLGSLLNGPNTLGGTIEVSHDDVFGRLGTGKAWAGVGIDENSATFASVGGGRGFADLKGGSLSVRGGFSHRTRDGVSLPRGATDPTATDGLRTNSDLNQSDAFASIRWNNDRGRSLRLLFSGSGAERGVPPEEHLAAPRLWRYPSNTRGMAAFSAKSGSIATPFGFGSFDVGMGYNTGRLRIQTFGDRTFQFATGEERGDEGTLSGRVLFTHSLPRGATLKGAITGADVRYVESLPPVADARYRQTLVSGGAEIEAPLGAATMLAGGLVYDRVSTPESGGRTPGARPFDNFGWRAGLSRDLGPAARVHASASRRSRFPSLRELYSGALNRFTPNPDLKPETLTGVEAGFTVDRAWGPIPDGTIQIIGFRHNLDDAVVRITLSGPTRFYRVNRDRIQSTGAEVLAGLVFGENRERAVSLTGDAMIQTIRISDQTAGGVQRHAENNPERRGMVELGVPLPFAVRAFANARYTGKQYCLNAESGGEMTLAAQTEHDVAFERSVRVAGRGLFSSLRALVSVDNVTDVVAFDQCGLVQPGRTVRLMFTLR
jgi:iron complex outermembrane receptor protein